MATRRPTPNAPADSFAGAEQSAENQKRLALAYVAQYGKRGLEALVNQRRAVSGQTAALSEDADSLARDFGAPEGYRSQLASKARSAIAPYARDAAAARQGYDEDMRSMISATSTYFDQVREAVPMERSVAQRTVAEYRTAWEENESRRVAEEEQREIARRQQEEAMAFARQQQAEQLALARQAQAQQASQHAASLAASAQQFAAQQALARREMELTYPGPGGAYTTGRKGFSTGRKGFSTWKGGGTR